jgi:long-subunit acyl-CoA synthetase (AMP-forming)
VIPSEFTIEGGEFTPTMKVKRRVVEERWRGVIEQLYEEGGVSAGAFSPAHQRPA